MPLVFTAFIAIPPLAFSLVGLIWVRYSLKAKRNHKPYLAAARVIMAALSFAVAAYVMSIDIRILEL